jgi:FMN reductase
MAGLVVVMGSVTPPGRSLKAMEFAVRCAGEESPGIDARLINLRDYRIAFADGRQPNEFGDDTEKLVEVIGEAATVIFASPVYRGSFTGSLKNLIDHLPVEALMGKPCGIIAIGATEHHFLGVDWHLRDVLGWFGALVAPTSAYLSAKDFADGEPNDDARAQLRALVSTVIKLRAAAGAVGPIPLAARRR